MSGNWMLVPAVSAADRIEAVAQAIRLECGAGDSWPVEFADSNLWAATLRAIAAELRKEGAPVVKSQAGDVPLSPLLPRPGGEMREAIFRVGRKLGRTIYEGDELIGVMDTTILAMMVVDALNARTKDAGGG